MASLVKRVLVGKPLASADEAHTRLIKIVALAVFASDAISSTAYASEEILHVLVPVAAAGALNDLIPISIIVMILLALVSFSYRQTIFAYPSGGGSYVVCKDNLGEKPALVAGASLMVDYVLTVAVSISAGVAAITSAVDSARPYRVEICLAFVLILTLANLRGLKESGTVFAVPTYVYIISLGFMLLLGFWKWHFGSLPTIPPVTERYDQFTDGKYSAGTLGAVGALLYMRAFSSGAVALTGVEAISNGVPAFKKPESRNAAKTLVAMSCILGGYFFLISVMAQHLRPTLSDDETVLSLMGGAIFGKGTFLYYVLQISTMAILTLAANTAFADFPRVASILAKDGYLPRQLSNRGDRLVFSNGIVALGMVASVLIIIFGGITTKLIPLYAVGVFCGFTLSQYGMVRHHARLKDPGWRRHQVINMMGAIATGVVLVVVVVSKFRIGAWVPLVLIPIISFTFLRVKRHYDRVAAALVVEPGYKTHRHTHTVIVLVGSINRATLAALSYAKSLTPDRLVAMTVVNERHEAEEIQEQWAEFKLDIPLHIESSPYRELAGPVLKYVDDLDAAHQNDIVTVILPEFVLTKWWEQLLHNQSALVLKARLLFRKNTVVVSVPYHIEHGRVEVPGDDPAAPAAAVSGNGAATAGSAEKSAT